MLSDVINLKASKSIQRNRKRNKEAQMRLKGKDISYLILSTISDFVQIYDLDKQEIIFMNNSAECMNEFELKSDKNYPYSHYKLIVHPADLIVLEKFFADAISAIELPRYIEYRLRTLDNKYKWMQVTVNYFTVNRSGRPTQVVGIARDITSKKIVDEIKSDNLKYMQKITIIDELIFNNNDDDYILSALTDTILQLFNADRCWIHSAIDPNEIYINVAAESTKNEFPGVVALNKKIKRKESNLFYDNTIAKTYGPVVFGQHLGNPISQAEMEWNVKSSMVIRLKPQIGEPWVLGLHQCSHNRVWTQVEKLLISDIAQRVEIMLNKILLNQKMKEKEEIYDMIFKNDNSIILVTNAEGKLLFANNNAINFLDENSNNSSKLTLDAKLKLIIPEFYHKFHYLFQFKSEYSFEFNLESNQNIVSHNICRLLPIINSSNEVDLVVSEISLKK